MKKLLLIGSDTIHTYKYIELVKNYFGHILLLTNKINPEHDVDSRVLDFSLKSIKAQTSTPGKIKSICKEFRPDIVHVHSAGSGAYYALKALRKRNVPVIVSAWGSDILYTPKKNFIMKKMVQYILKNGDAFTSDSKFMAEEMNILARKKLDITIANFGIDIEPMNLPKENIIYSNRLHKKLYRIDKIISAFEKFSKSQNEEWKLIIAATGKETENLKKIAKRSFAADKIEFAGWVDKKKNSEFYSRAKIFVSIPESDATSISLLEAMACGCLPVVSDLPANREWIKHGENGLLVNEINSDFFSEVLGLNLNQAKETNSLIVNENGSKQINKEKFIGLYEKLLK